MKKITFTPIRKKLFIKTLLAFPFVLYFFWGAGAPLGVVLSIVTLNLLFVLFADESFLLEMMAKKAFMSNDTSPPPDYLNDPKYGFAIRNMKRRAGIR